MANSISDVKINVTVADVVSSCEFGVPLLYQPDGGIGYKECYDINEVKENVSALYDVAVTADCAGLATGNQVLGSTINKIFDENVQYLPATHAFVVESDTKTVDDKKYTTRVKDIYSDGYIRINVESDKSNIRIVAIGSNETANTTVILRSDAEMPTEGKIYDTYSLGGSAVETITFKDMDAGVYCLYAGGNNKMHVYAIYIDEASEEATILIEQANKIFSATTPPEKIAVLCCPVSSIANYAGYDWRQLIYNGSVDNAKKIAEIIETMEEDKLFYFEYGESDSLGDNVADINELKTYERTVISYAFKADNGNYSVAEPICSSLIGETATKDVGSYTYKNIKLQHVNPIDNIKNSQLTAIHDAGAFCCVSKSGYTVSSEGKTASGEYIDVIDARDWIVMNMEYQLQQALIINDKVPYTNNGIALLESYCLNVLKKAYSRGMIAENDDGTPAYTVDFAKRSETDAGDRKARRYIEGKFSFDLAGAIHTVTVNGTINI